MEDSKILLMVTTDDEGRYNVTLGAGSNVNECAFCMMVIMKCLIKSNLIKDSNEMIELINKYFNDQQYEEVE